MTETITLDQFEAKQRKWAEDKAKELYAQYGNSDIPVELDNAWFNSLKCPFCDNDELHQDEVQIIWREEDSNEGLHIESRKDETYEVDNDARQATGRRDSLAITFWCEQCPTRPRLIVYQHKGKTIVVWDNDSVIDKSLV